MTDNLPLAKYCKIANAIIHRITAGEFKPGERLPGTRELISEYETTTATITSTLRFLDEQGWINKVQGRGVFVRERQKNTTRKTNLKLGVAMDYSSSDTIIFNDFLIKKLTEAGFRPNLIQLNTALLNDLFARQCDKTKELEHIKEENFDHLIFRGAWHFPFSQLYCKYNDFKQISWAFLYDTDLVFPGSNIIVPDWYAIGCKTAGYLIANGRKRLISMEYETPEKFLKITGGAPNWRRERLRGIKAAMTDAGLDPDQDFCSVEIPFLGRNAGLAKLFALLDSGQGWDGVLLPSDVESVEIYRHYRNSDRLTRGKLGLIGLYASYWTSAFTPCLPSIAIDAKAVAENMTDIIINGKRDKRCSTEFKLVEWN